MPASDERRLQALILAPVRRVRRRLNAVRFAEAGVAPVWAAATGCVLLRLLVRDSALWALPLPWLAAGAWWFFRARARRVSLAQAAVLADRSAGAGGLLLTRLERPVGEWELSANQYARAVTLPPVPWKRPAGALGAALAFLALGLWLPLPAPPVRSFNAAAAAKVAAVQAKAETLAREESPGAPIEEELRRLAAEVAEDRFDAADWEAADRLEKSLEARAAKAAAELAAASEAARELGESLDAAAGTEAATRGREALENALMALERGEGGREGSGGEGAGTPRSSAELAQLRETLERRRQQLEQRFGQGAGRPGNAEGEGRGEGPKGHTSRQAGRGGAGRGGDSQPLVFGEKAEMDPDRLAFKPLPRGQGGEAQELWGLRAAEPERREGGAGGGGRGTGAQGDAEAGHAAGPLLPRNRELVKRYFGEQP
ncbi:hypothetical protein [Melittangium boletus]|uniref:Uncharacterized protein n=1 Tax=Melittangium boletus DSM 14713 TaxID=1294270 RepID=A0A250ICT2_9BACT|nr:hypothetical protein [Melittangium boletus]ATB28756.1 hypothetical protein MEBOL_002205 [Melittangium boletus DSM 14713]